MKMGEYENDADYYKSKIDKLEVENNQLRHGKGENKKLKELSNECEMLKVQLEDAQRNGGQSTMAAGARNMDLRNVKKQLTPEEQLQLQREISQLDLMLKGYENENQKLMKRNRTVEDELKHLEASRQQEQVELKGYKLKALKEKSGVYVEADEDEVDIQAKNVMGGASISAKQLADLYSKLK